VKNLFGLFWVLYFRLVLFTSHKQVLTPIDNLQRLLSLPIFDKPRLVTFYKTAAQRNYTNWFLPLKENESAHDLDSLCAIVKMIVAEQVSFG
jgi:hypothetical protein